MKTGPGTLKCVIAPGVGDDVLVALLKRFGTEDFRRASPGVALVYTTIEASELRDRIAAESPECGALMVIEFEKWSSYGAEVDRVWLLARGH